MSEPLPHFFKRHYTPAELIADALVHGLAIAGGLIGFAILFFRLGQKGDAENTAAIGVYAIAFFVLFGCSCAYNLSPPSRTKWLLRRLDHAAIFLMISGTYTALLSLTKDGGAWVLASCVWLVSLIGAGVALLAPPGRFDRLLLALYLALGWGALADAPRLTTSLPPETVILTVAGGVMYSLGVPFHLWNSLKFQSAIWHGFVAVASACQFAGIAKAVGP
ncbi:hemolysin III family protein [Rhodoblastus acidophilus]|uniref:Hemolysin III family protein n=1 Tax=Rhodoblastus acidophilus TaxID=1074 RepID=A0A6N8DPU1_RHOAC|nr:hemolysin III family protein [Rhodoblastus acidophilus]MCW2274346.1 hemolysin III [Rhodoblastus acidophilus]MTV31201.1 hemolysin III family protein [Rhodoblastus acidophilus]